MWKGRCVSRSAPLFFPSSRLRSDFPVKCSLYLTDVWLHNCSLQVCIAGINPRVLVHEKKTPFNMSPKMKWDTNRGSRDAVSFFAFAAPEQLSMWKMSEWDSVCKDGDSIWLFMHHHTHLMTITIILLLKQLTGSYPLFFPPYYT